MKKTHNSAEKMEEPCVDRGGLRIEAGQDSNSALGRWLQFFVLQAALISFGLIFALVLVEIGFRAFMSGGAAKVAWRDRPTAYYKHETAKTLQDYYYNKVKPEGVYRIGVVGDSFTFATQMQFDDAFPKKLERMLNLTRSGRKVEVLNFGVPGYSTTHEVGATKVAVAYESDLIVLQVTLNDPQIKGYVPTGISGKNDYGEIQVSRRFKKLFSFWKSAGYVDRRLHNTQTHRDYKQYYKDLFEKEKPLNAFRAALGRIARIKNRSKTPIVAVVFPLFGVALDDAYPFHPQHKTVHDLLDEHGIPYVDLFSTYKGIPLERIQLIPGQDFHPNEIGHRMAAEKLYEWLETENHLPGDVLIREKYKTRLDIRPARNGMIAGKVNAKVPS